VRSRSSLLSELPYTGRRILYGDLHFHTNHSDNRDRASVRQMVDRGVEEGLSIMGIGDHNHNLDRESWETLREELRKARRGVPRGTILMANCEITFRRGHALTLMPRRIEGHVMEGFAHLYRARSLVINHPFEQNDEWHLRILPHAIGIEVINGAAFRGAGISTADLASVLDIPTVRTYADYLDAGVPVAAMGASDAHSLAELGSGATGFLLAGRHGPGAVIRAIEERKTFATTRVGLGLFGDRGQNGRLRWRLLETSAGRVSVKGARVRIYRGTAAVAAGGASADIASSEPGLYWASAICGDDILVSSPVAVGRIEAKPLAGAWALACDDLARMKLRLGSARVRAGRSRDFGRRFGSSGPSTRSAEPSALVVIAGDERIRVQDATGKPVVFKAERTGEPVVVLERDYDRDQVGEVLLWLRRGEIHEHALTKVRWMPAGRTLEADLVPAIQLLEGNHPTWSAEAHQLAGLDWGSAIHVRFVVPAQWKLSCGPELRFPLRVFDPALDAESRVYALSCAEYADRRLSRLFGPHRPRTHDGPTCCQVFERCGFHTSGTDS
jgi:hypothetical protein